MKKPETFLKHILTEIEYLQRKSEKLEYNHFINNEDLKRSFIRALEVIGEATKNLPVSIRKEFSETEWKKMSGLRDILIHQYFGINYIAVWDIVKNKIPLLKEQIEHILKETGSSD